jgi:hypothetical protein
MEATHLHILWTAWGIAIDELLHNGKVLSCCRKLVGDEEPVRLRRGRSKQPSALQCLRKRVLLIAEGNADKWDGPRTVTDGSANGHVSAASDELFDDVGTALPQGSRRKKQRLTLHGLTSVAAIMRGVHPLLQETFSSKTC